MATLSRRQRSDGGIGLWSGTDWTTPWLTAYAGGVLLDAREAGLAVDDSVLARLGVYLKQSLTQNQPVVGPVARWYISGQARLSDRVRAVDYLSRAGLRDRPAENELLRLSVQLAWEDRVRLALVLARGGDRDPARSLLEPAWRSVRVEGRTATLPPEARRDVLLRLAHAAGRLPARRDAGRRAGASARGTAGRDPRGPGARHVVGVEHAGLRHRRRGAGGVPAAAAGGGRARRAGERRLAACCSRRRRSGPHGTRA